MLQSEKIEIIISKNVAKIELGDALDKLLDNRNFKKLISKGYMEDYLKAQTLHLGCSPDPDTRDNCVNNIAAIGALRGFLMYIEKEANEARQSVEWNEDELTRARQEELQMEQDGEE